MPFRYSDNIFSPTDVCICLWVFSSVRKDNQKLGFVQMKTLYQGMSFLPGRQIEKRIESIMRNCAYTWWICVEEKSTFTIPKSPQWDVQENYYMENLFCWTFPGYCPNDWVYVEARKYFIHGKRFTWEDEMEKIRTSWKEGRGEREQDELLDHCLFVFFAILLTFL